MSRSFEIDRECEADIKVLIDINNIDVAMDLEGKLAKEIEKEINRDDVFADVSLTGIETDPEGDYAAYNVTVGFTDQVTYNEEIKYNDYYEQDEPAYIDGDDEYDIAREMESGIERAVEKFGFDVIDIYTEDNKTPSIEEMEERYGSDYDEPDHDPYDDR